MAGRCTLYAALVGGPGLPTSEDFSNYVRGLRLAGLRPVGFAPRAGSGGPRVSTFLIGDPASAEIWLSPHAFAADNEFRICLARGVFGSYEELADATQAIVMAGPDEFYLPERVKRRSGLPCPLCGGPAGIWACAGHGVFTPFPAMRATRAGAPVCIHCASDDPEHDDVDYAWRDSVLAYWILPRQVTMFSGVGPLPADTGRSLLPR